jgi:hypothetical protein
MHVQPDEVCPICSRPQILVQDHDHETGLNRDMICQSCNQLVGHFDRPTAFIKRVLDYLGLWERTHAEGKWTPYVKRKSSHKKRNIESLECGTKESLH